MSAVGDGTDIWVFQRNGTTGDSESFKCSACGTSSPTWTDIAEPWGSGLTDTELVGLSYISGSNELVAFLSSGTGTSEVINFKATNADTISWDSTNRTLGYSPGADGLEHFYATPDVASDSQVAGVVREITGIELEFATLFEKTLILVLLAPFLPGVLGKLKKRRRH